MFITKSSNWQLSLFQLIQIKQTESWATIGKHYGLRGGHWEKRVGKNPVGEKQTGNLGRNWAQAHKVILLGYVHEKNYEMRQIGVGLEWLPTCKRRVIILGTFTKGLRPTPCCSRAADIYVFLFKIYIFRLIRQHLNARNSISFVTIMAKKI